MTDEQELCRQLEGVLPWMRHLPAGALREFLSEIAGWEATAEAYADPDVLEALREPISDYGPVPEPAPEDAGEAPVPPKSITELVGIFGPGWKGDLNSVEFVRSQRDGIEVRAEAGEGILTGDAVKMYSEGGTLEAAGPSSPRPGEANGRKAAARQVRVLRGAPDGPLA